MLKYSVLLPLLAALSLFSLAFALALGSVDVPWTQLLTALFDQDQGLASTLVWELRLPRAASAFVVGGLLALSGALMQVLLRNPLADSYVLGVSGGAAVGALGAMLVGLNSRWISGSSFCGALFSMLLVFGLAQGRGGWTSTRLLLTGVVVAAGWGGVISFLLAVSPDANLRGMLFWLMGDLSHAGAPGWNLAVLLAGLTLAFGLARQLNLMARGDLQAAALGVQVTGLRLTIYFLASLLTASAVTLAGSIGFLGLVVPHMIRLLAGGDYRLLVPACVLLGGSLLVLADTLARTLLAPQQLPVGVITAFLGVPIFLLLLYRGPQAARS